MISNIEFAQTDSPNIVGWLEAVSILKEAKKSGRLFSATFERRVPKKLEDGTFSKTRNILCRGGVTKGVTGKGMAYDPDNYALLTTYDMGLARQLAKKGNTKQKAFRHINLIGLKRFKVRGEEYIVLDAIQEFDGISLHCALGEDTQKYYYFRENKTGRVSAKHNEDWYLSFLGEVDTPSKFVVMGKFEIGRNNPTK